MIEEFADRWGALRRDDGKVVWFEFGRFDDEKPGRHPSVVKESIAAGRENRRLVTLRRVPLLMHWAWQEHAAALLREYLLHVLDEDDTIFDQHARASAAMRLLADQLPTPQLPDSADALMTEAVDPDATADELVLSIPADLVVDFAVLDDLLKRAITEARAGRFLGPPTQPEIDDMRRWICTEVARQAAGDSTATPWLARTDVRATMADQAQLTATYARLGTTDEPVLATDEASIIVAVSEAALELLGYDRDEQLLGRRVIVVVPARYHQAHIAGTTLNATNGRDNLLGVPLTVPIVRADGTEVRVYIEVRPESFEGRRVFVARFRAASTEG